MGGGQISRKKTLRNKGIGLYRDVWIAAIASSRKSLATQTAAICVRFHGRRVRHVYVTMQITFLARKSALIYRRGLRQRVASLIIDCNGVFAIRAYGVLCAGVLFQLFSLLRPPCPTFSFAGVDTYVGSYTATHIISCGCVPTLEWYNHCLH